jgi:ABC-2 type transport system ATP-binding protein
MLEMAVLEAVGLCKSYGAREALSPVSFRLEGGSGLALTGENGSGKSTLLRLLAQIEKPDAGDMLFNGKSVLGNRAFLRKNVGYVPQEPALDVELTVAAQLRVWAAACGCRRDARSENLLGLGELLRQKIGELSGGQARRVSIALAMMNSPRLLLLDEAFTGLDETYSEALGGALYEFVGAGGILVCATHRPEEAATFCKYGITLREGRAV